MGVQRQKEKYEHQMMSPLAGLDKYGRSGRVQSET